MGVKGFVIGQAFNFKIMIVLVVGVLVKKKWERIEILKEKEN